MIELHGTTLINDGHWHEIRAQFNPSYMEVAVDGGQPVSLRPSLGENRHIDLSGLLYFGGLETGQRLRAYGQGVRSASGEKQMQGCLQVRRLLFAFHVHMN